MALTRFRTLVRDLMQVGVATCPPETPIADISRIMTEKKLDAVIVIDSDEGHALGVVSQEELVQAFVKYGTKTVSAAEVMKEGIPQIPPDIPLEVAVQTMRDLNVRTLFLMHHAGGIVYPAAYISYAHILRYLAAQNEEDLSGLGVEAERKNPLDAFFEKRDAARAKVQSKRRE
jgi:CBS domain-containing protein